MKKVWCFLLVIMFVICLTACGSNGSPTSDAADSSTAESSVLEVKEDALLSGLNSSVSDINEPSSAEDISSIEGTSSDTDVNPSMEDGTSNSMKDVTDTEEASSNTNVNFPMEDETSNSAKDVTDIDETSSNTAVDPSIEDGTSNSMKDVTDIEEATSDTEVVTSVENETSTSNERSEDEVIMQQNTFYVTVGGKTFSATFAENSGAQALKELLADGDITLQMNDYGGFEKVGSLGQSLPTENSQTTTQAGDIVLYQGNQIVIFYGSNSWSYTRLGKIDDLTGWQEALGNNAVSVKLSLNK